MPKYTVRGVQVDENTPQYLMFEEEVEAGDGIEAVRCVTHTKEDAGWTLYDVIVERVEDTLAGYATATIRQFARGSFNLTASQREALQNLNSKLISMGIEP